MTHLLYIFLVIVWVNGEIFDEACGQQLKNPGTTAGGIRASVAPWTVSIGSHFSRFSLIFF